MDTGTHVLFEVQLGDYGADQLRLTGFRGAEAISELFEYEVDLAIRDEEIGLADVVGQEAVLMMRDPEGDRSVYGIVAQLERTARGPRFTHYRARIVPRAWTLTLRHDCRIFQEQDIVAIITEVLKDGGLSADQFEFRLRGTHPRREYCVQYRESDWNFVSRLMEEEGVAYFFDHADEMCKLVMVDDPTAYRTIGGDPSIPYREQDLGRGERESITQFRFRRQLRPAKVILRDFDFKRPSLPLESEAEGGADAESALFLYDFPGEYNDSSVGGALAQVRLEELRAISEVGTGEGACLRKEAGHKFSLEDHPLDEFNCEYLLTRVQHRCSQPASTDEEAGVAEEPTYQNTFECIPADQTFRSHRVTPRPRVQGPQTAVVRGPAGEEIHCDPYARVKVQFHWDRRGKNDDRSSCWIRVCQGWAGGGWGMIIIPRIGQEVVVDFLEGDPDQPIITGRVYNGENQPPYALPANKTRSSLMTSTSPGGGGYNEIRLEDSSGHEEIFIHGQKDWNTVIENDRTTLIKHDETAEVVHDRSRTVKHDETVHVVNDRTKTIDNDQTENIGRHKATSVGGDHSEQITGDMDITVSGKLTESVAISYSETVGGAMDVTVGGGLSVSVGAALSQTIGAGSSETVDGDKSLRVGGDSAQDVAGDQTCQVGKDSSVSIEGKAVTKVTKEATLEAKKIMIQAQDEITLKTGSAQITMKKNGDITIKGKKITIKGSSDVVIKGSKIAEN
jgi:type VI secretion system secreted protein VgrG